MVKVMVELPFAASFCRLVIVAALPPTVTVSAWLARSPGRTVTAVVPTGPLVGLRPVADWRDREVGAGVAEWVPSETTTAGGRSGRPGS